MNKSRILDCQRFQMAGDLENQNILSDLNLKQMTPVLDRWSPLSYSIAKHIHINVSKHTGYESSYRECLNHVYVIHGLSLCREIGEDCVFCAKKRKKYLDISMGPISDHQLTVAPAFYVTMCDLFGPLQVFVPGHAMKTRHRNVVEAKCYGAVFICPVTKLTSSKIPPSSCPSLPCSSTPPANRRKLPACVSSRWLV